MDNVGWVRFASCAALCAVMDFHGRWFVHWLSSRDQLTNASPFIINSLIKCSSYLPIDDKLSSWTDSRLAEFFLFKIQSGDSRLSYQFSKFSFKNYFEKGKMFKNVFDSCFVGRSLAAPFRYTINLIMTQLTNDPSSHKQQKIELILRLKLPRFMRAQRLTSGCIKFFI